jgi:hypothetical protein
MKNINEEIKRIKSLFTEERLYGNLVEQTDQDCIDKLTDDDGDKYKIFKVGSEEGKDQSCIPDGSNLKKISEFFSTKGVEYTVSKQGYYGCFLDFTKEVGDKYKRLLFWERNNIFKIVVTSRFNNKPFTAKVKGEDKEVMSVEYVGKYKITGDDVSVEYELKKIELPDGTIEKVSGDRKNSSSLEDTFNAINK